MEVSASIARVIVLYCLRAISVQLDFVPHGSQSFDPRRLEVEIETPRGVSHTFSPVKSEFAFDKLVLKDFVENTNIRVCGKHRSISPDGGLGNSISKWYTAVHYTAVPALLPGGPLALLHQSNLAPECL